MADFVIPHKHCNVAFGLQDERGVAGTGVADGIIKLPLPEGTDLTNNKNYSFFQYSGGHYGPKHYESGGEYMEGTLRLPFIPGYTAAGDLYSWIWDRTGTYHQGYWGTIYRDMGGGLTETYIDVKVMSGTIAVDYGANYASVELNIAGVLQAEAGHNAGVATIFEVRPYRYKEAGLQLADGGTYGSPGAGLAASNVTRNHSLEFNNMAEAPGDMGTLSGSTFPYDLPNSAKAVWTGSYDRIFANTDIYDAFMGGEECAYRLTLTRAAVAACVIDMPRIVYTEDPLNAPDSGIVRESVSFQALESLDGETDACTVTETAP